MSTFSVDDKDKWRQAMFSIVSQIKNPTSGCKSLVVDLTANGGGYLDLAYEAVALLSPNPSPNWPMIDKRFRRDFRTSPLLRLLTETAFNNSVKKSSFHPSWYGEINEGLSVPYTDLSIINPSPTRNYTVNNAPVSEPYSNTFIELPEAHDPNDPSLNKLWGLNIGLSSNNIVLVSSGDCGSACGLLYYHLSQRDQVKGAVFGPMYRRPRTFGAFPITEVFTLREITSEAMLLKVQNNPLVPAYLPISGMVHTPIREGILLDNVTIAEFHWELASILIDAYERYVMRPDNVWRAAAEAMGWMQTPTQYANQAPYIPTAA